MFTRNWPLVAQWLASLTRSTVSLIESGLLPLGKHTFVGTLACATLEGDLKDCKSDTPIPSVNKVAY